MAAAAAFLKTRGDNHQVPGWSSQDERNIQLEAHPDFETYDFREENGQSASHYRVSRGSKDAFWKLQKYWQTDAHDHLIREGAAP
jgi:hypothetical protein